MARKKKRNHNTIAVTSTDCVSGTAAPNTFLSGCAPHACLALLILEDESTTEDCVSGVTLSFARLCVWAVLLLHMHDCSQDRVSGSRFLSSERGLVCTVWLESPVQFYEPVVVERSSWVASKYYLEEAPL